jgi:hypothetical protein
VALFELVLFARMIAMLLVGDENNEKFHSAQLWLVFPASESVDGRSG